MKPESAGIIRTRAPSNIAIIKYMGKKDPALNLPANPSLSLTLNNLCTIAELHKFRDRSSRPRVLWNSDPPVGHVERLALLKPELTPAGVERVEAHIGRVLGEIEAVLDSFGLEKDTGFAVEWRAANTFPTSAGVASSASSFAAITLAAAAASAKDLSAFQRVWKCDPQLRQSVASLSRLGSGSSCRSFFGPWVYWEDRSVSPLSSGLPLFSDLLLIISDQPKVVASSQAHARAIQSPLWPHRCTVLPDRVASVRKALAEADLKTLARLTWQEAMEMHSLFHTCEEPFFYLKAATLEVLDWFTAFLSDEIPPLITLDAGPNIHVLVPSSDSEIWKARLQHRFPGFSIMADQQGEGADFCGI